MNYSFHPHAERELEEIESHYDGILHELGNRFREDVEMTISKILKFPNGCQPLSEVFRRCRLNGFPYGIIYRVKPDEVRLLAVMHQRREPDYWKHRS
ncbi:MAG TPA: type II toxin-antitoxin system RelE/ParE family toxin [Pyrinomonadaceae bacterium]|jgi:plasmid stabilization system protein ParE